MIPKVSAAQHSNMAQKRAMSSPKFCQLNLLHLSTPIYHESQGPSQSAFYLSGSTNHSLFSFPTQPMGAGVELLEMDEMAVESKKRAMKAREICVDMVVYEQEPESD